MESGRDERTDAPRAARLALTGLVVQAALAAVALGAAFASGSLVALGVAAHVGAGVLAWASGAFLAQRRRAQAEQEAEDQRLARAAQLEGRTPLFRRDAAPRSEARAGAVLAVALALVEGGLAVAVVAIGRARAQALLPGTEPVFEHLLGSAAALAGSSFVLLLLAKFSLALASGDRAPAGSPLAFATAGARRAASAALVAFAGGVLLAVAHVAPSLRLDFLGYVLAAVEGLLAVELLASLVLELYRPRRKGDVPRPAFESRLLALFAEPGGVARSFARAVDYQFGFQLSDTWVYGLVERGMAPLGAFFALSLWLLSCVVVVPQGSVGLEERLGTARAELEPGLHVKLPWPFEAVELVDRDRVRTIVLGGDEEQHEHDRRPGRLGKAVLWTKAHGDKDEFLLLVARPDRALDLLEAHVTVSYVVAKPVSFARSAVAPEKFLQALGERELARLGCSHDLDALVGPGRDQAAVDLAARIQESADRHELGVRILAAGLEDVHPPARVAKDFHAIAAATADSAARRLQGKADAAQLAPRAEAEARGLAGRARNDAAQRRLLATSEAQRFRAALELDRASPRAFRTTRFLRTLEEALAAMPGRRFILPAGSRGGSIDVDMGEKLSTEDLGLDTGSKK
jgi:regulator of protease activity HflC (stomatin/prohibitin superfamily)